MKQELKKSAPVYVGLFGVAAVIAVLARIGLAVMDASGVLGYNYRAATSPYGTEGLSTLDQLPMTLTGGTFIGFIFAGGLALCLAVAASLLFAHVFAGTNEGSAGTALVWGFATAIVSFACLFAIVLGLYSHVLLSQMTSKGGGGLLTTLGLLFVCVGTLVAASSMVLRSAWTRGSGSGKHAIWSILLAAVCGAVVCVLTVGTFGAINAEPAQSGAVVGWLLAAVVCNIVMLFIGSKLSQK